MRASMQGHLNVVNLLLAAGARTFDRNSVSDSVVVNYAHLAPDLAFVTFYHRLATRPGTGL
jgi:hypothetical protein